jgi:hypothetical protein
MKTIKILKGKKNSNINLLGLIGEHYHYSNDDKIISLIYPSLVTFNMYEIYCVAGDLFEDTERYSTLKEVEKRIESLLGERFKFGRL